MSYATRADLEARFGAAEIADLAHGEAGRVDMALADAAAEIDGALAVAYDLPLSAGTYPLLRAIAADIARERLYDDAALEEPKRKAKQARMRLAKLRNGELQLVSGAGAVIERRNRAAYAGPAPAMTPDNLAGL